MIGHRLDQPFAQLSGREPPSSDGLPGFLGGPSRFTSNYQYRTDVEQLHSTEDMV
jgi:hypothetical protein